MKFLLISQVSIAKNGEFFVLELVFYRVVQMQE